MRSPPRSTRRTRSWPRTNNNNVISSVGKNPEVTWEPVCEILKNRREILKIVCEILNIVGEIMKIVCEILKNVCATLKIVCDYI